MSAQDLLCEEKHKNIDATLERHEQVIGIHGVRLDTLERNEARHEAVVQSLCEQIKNLTTAIWWLIGLFVTGGVGFFVWYIQSLPR